MTTSKSFARGHDLHVWQMEIPQQACCYDFLLDGILAVACSQRASSSSDVRGMDWAARAIDYQNRALKSFSPTLLNLDLDNCHATFAFSLLIVITAFYLLSAESVNLITDFLEIRRYLDGTAQINLHVGDKLGTGPLRGLFQDADGRDMSMFWDSNAPEDNDW